MIDNTDKSQLIYLNHFVKCGTTRDVQQMFDETHCDALVLGCTELSLAQDREPVTDKPMIDSQSILVDRSLELALKAQKG